MNNHVTHELAVEPPVLTDADVSHALAMAREKALQATDDRRAILTAAAVEVERWTYRLLWPGDGGAARRYVSVVDVDDYRRPVSIAPGHPDLANVEAAGLTVEVWTDDGTWTAASFEALPGGRVRVDRPGSFRVTVDCTPEAPAPVNAREAVGRLYAMRETRRSGDDDGGGVELPNLANAMIRSGAGEVARALRRRLIL